MNKPLIHFGSFDPRFCCSTELHRRFDLDPNEITCEACKGSDTFAITHEGASFLRELGELK